MNPLSWDTPVLRLVDEYVIGTKNYNFPRSNDHTYNRDNRFYDDWALRNEFVASETGFRNRTRFWKRVRLHYKMYCFGLRFLLLWLTFSSIWYEGLPSPNFGQIIGIIWWGLYDAFFTRFWLQFWRLFPVCFCCFFFALSKFNIPLTIRHLLVCKM